MYLSAKVNCEFSERENIQEALLRYTYSLNSDTNRVRVLFNGTESFRLCRGLNF